MLKILFKRITKFWSEYDAFGRIFWLITLTLSTYGMTIFSYFIYQEYRYNPVSIIIETHFNQWNLSFPAVSVCLVPNTRSAQQREIIKNLNITVTGSFAPFMGKLKHCIFSNPNYLNFDIVECLGILAKNGLTSEELKKAFLTRDCYEVVESVYYDNTLYNCSDILKFHLTQYGYCFIINSIIDRENIKLKYDITTDSRRLSLNLKPSKTWKYMFFVHSPEDLPSENSFKQDVGRGGSMFSFNSVPIITDAEAAKIPINVRKCRFPHEKLGNYPVHYSFSTCIAYLRINLELQHCNCTFSSSPEKYKSRYCDIEGTACLVNGNFYARACQLAMDNNVCIPPCSEQLLTYVGESVGNEDTANAHISINIANMPMSRYRRTVSHSPLDLAVSIAGLAGLFFGASVLNFVELVYYMITGR